MCLSVCTSQLLEGGSIGSEVLLIGERKGLLALCL
jgi:hypothetical protein